jgi:hypothetical protein
MVEPAIILLLILAGGFSEYFNGVPSEVCVNEDALAWLGII